MNTDYNNSDQKYEKNHKTT